MGLKDRTRVERLVREAQSITADTALRLGRVFGISAEMWLNMQAAHNLSTAAIRSRQELARIQSLTPAARLKPLVTDSLRLSGQLKPPRAGPW